MSNHRSRPRVEGLESRIVPALYYVATTGTDGSPGTDVQPWRTLQYAADHVHAGDTVTVRAGDYAGFDLTTSGTATAPISFLADSGARVTTPNPVTPDGINLEGASFVVIDGFTVINQPRTGIRSVTNQHVTIRHNTVDGNYDWGILTGFSDDLLIEGNVASRSQVQHGIYVGNSGDRPVIRGNVVWGNYQCGIHMNGDASEGGDGIISDALVENNVVYSNGNGGGSGINCDGVQNSVIRNNLIYDERASGISLYQIDGGGPSSGNTVENNTVLVASTGRWALNVQNAATNTAARNNILYNYGSYRGAVDISPDSLPGLASDYNAVISRFTTDDGDTVQSLAQWQSQTGQDAHSLVAAPTDLFVDPANANYHLKAGSPAIDRGTSTGAPPTDYEGDARPQGAGFDIGHDEFVPLTPPPPPPPPMPPPPPASGQVFAVGTDAGTVGTVTVYKPDGTASYSVRPFGSSYTGGVKVATGDVTGDGVPDVVVGTMTGGGKARVIDGATRAMRSGSVFSSSSYTGLVEVAVGDVTGDGVADIAVGTNEGAPRVRVYRGGDFVKVADFVAVRGTGYAGRGRVALADVTGDKVADLVVSGLFADGTHVAVFDGTTLRPKVTPARAFPDFVLTGTGFANGVNLAAGDLNGDGSADLVFGSASGGGRVLALSGRDLRSGTRTTLADFTASGSGYAGGVRVGLRDLDGDGRADLLAGSAAGSEVRSYLGGTVSPSGEPPAFFDFTAYPGFAGGVFVG